MKDIKSLRINAISKRAKKQEICDFFFSFFFSKFAKENEENTPRFLEAIIHIYRTGNNDNSCMNLHEKYFVASKCS